MKIAIPKERRAHEARAEGRRALLGLLGLLALRMALQAPLVLLDRLVPKVLLAILQRMETMDESGCDCGGSPPRKVGS